MFKFKIPFVNKSEHVNKNQSNELTVFSVESFADFYVLSVNIKNYEKRFGKITDQFDTFYLGNYIRTWPNSRWDLLGIGDCSKFNSKKEAENAIKKYLKSRKIIDKSQATKVYNLDI
jgi:hypothetical protein